MPFVPVTNIAEVFVEHNLNDTPDKGWVLHYEKTAGAWTQETLVDLGEALITWWDTNLQPLVGAHMSLTRIRLRDLTTQNGLIADVTSTLPITGTLSGTPPSNNVAWSLKKMTGFSGRSFRGRVYHMGMTESVVNGNLIDTGHGNSVITAWNEALFLSGGVADYGMVVVSKYSGGSPRVLGLATDCIAIAAADYRVDTRRDRM